MIDTELVKFILLSGKSSGALDSSLRFTVGIGIHFNDVRIRVSSTTSLVPVPDSELSSIEAYVKKAIKAHDEKNGILGRGTRITVENVRLELPDTI